MHTLCCTRCNVRIMIYSYSANFRWRTKKKSVFVRSVQSVWPFHCMRFVMCRRHFLNRTRCDHPSMPNARMHCAIPIAFAIQFATRKTRICVVRAMCDVVRSFRTHLVDCVICFVMMFLRPQKLHRSNSKTMRPAPARHQWQRQKGQPPPIGLRLASMHNDEWRLYMMASEPRRRTEKKIAECES